MVWSKAASCLCSHLGELLGPTPLLVCLPSPPVGAGFIHSSDRYHIPIFGNYGMVWYHNPIFGRYGLTVRHDHHSPSPKPRNVFHLSSVRTLAVSPHPLTVARGPRTSDSSRCHMVYHNPIFGNYGMVWYHNPKCNCSVRSGPMHGGRLKL